MNSYMTLLTKEEDIVKILILNNQLQYLNSSFPLSCITTVSLATKVKEIFKKEKILLFSRIDPAFPKNFWKGKKRSEEKIKELYKLFIFSHTLFDKIIFLDNNLWIQKNIDFLFDSNNFSMPCISLKSFVNELVQPLPSYNLICFRPHLKYQRHFLGTMENKNSYDIKVLLDSELAIWRENTNLHLPFFTYLNYSEKILITDKKLYASFLTINMDFISSLMQSIIEKETDDFFASIFARIQQKKMFYKEKYSL